MDSAQGDTSRPKALPSVLLNLIPSLQCPICFTILKNPKLMSCGHTFCHNCLSKVECQNESLACPLCRVTTQIDNGSVEKLPTNIALKSVVEEATHLQGKCDLCHIIVSPYSLSYCYDCSVSVCSLCLSQNQAKHPDHFIKSRRTSRGPSPIIQVHCDIHNKRPCKYICISCDKYICRECLGTHKEQCHETQEITTFKGALQIEAATLGERLKIMESKSSEQVQKYEYVKHSTLARIDKVESQIHSEYHAMIDRLFEEKVTLIRHCSALKKELSKRSDVLLAGIKESNCLLETAISDTNDISKYPFQNSPSNISSSFDKIEKRIKDSTWTGIQIAGLFRDTVQESFMIRFEKNRNNKDDLIGQLNRYEWIKNSIVLNHPEQSMTCTAVDRQGRVFIGYFKGGVDILCDRRSYIQRLNSTCVMAMAFNCEGNLILRNTDNDIFVYGHAFEKSNVKFDTIGYEEGGYGDLYVDGKDDIYVSYRDIQKVNIYKGTGGQAFREIHCKQFNPQQILVMQTSDIVVMNGPTIRTIDVNGREKSSVFRKGFLGYPAVSSDGNLYIAWVNHEKDYFEIVQYTNHNDLKNYETLHKDETTDLSGRRWYYFQVIAADKLAFCTPKELHIFTLNVRPYVNKKDNTSLVRHYSQYGELEQSLGQINEKTCLASCFFEK